jgi:hypothetical protein
MQDGTLQAIRANRNESGWKLDRIEDPKMIALIVGIITSKNLIDKD